MAIETRIDGRRVVFVPTYDVLKMILACNPPPRLLGLFFQVNLYLPYHIDNSSRDGSRSKK